MRELIRTGDGVPTISVRLSATTGMQGKRTFLTIPFNNVEFDNHPGVDARPFSISALSYGDTSSPQKSRITSWSTYRNAVEDDVRQTVAGGILLTIESDADAPALVDVPLVMFCLGPTTEIDLDTISLPAVTPTGGTPWTVRDADGVEVGCLVTMEDL